MSSKYSKLLIVLLNLITTILFFSCSTVPKSDFQNSYYSPDYKDKSFENVQMDICMPKANYENFSGWDSISLSFQKDFEIIFREYFPDGIKMFSSVTKTAWIYYETNFELDPILYDKQSKDGNYLYSVSMPDSLSFFQRRSKSDFLLVIHYITFAGNPPITNHDKSKFREDYESIITLRYSLWNTLNLDLLATDEVNTSLIFKKLGEKWPLRGVILKSAYEVFQRLPMFSK